MRLVTLCPYREAQSFAPSALSEFFDVLLAAKELALAVFGVEEKALEIAKAVEDQTGNFAVESYLPLAAFRSQMFYKTIASRGRLDRVGVAAEPTDPGRNLVDVTHKDQ